MEYSATQRVAILGAGASGIFSAAHLIASGIEVEVFERNAAPGGVWLYDERPALPPPFPSIKASKADAPLAACEDGEDVTLRRAPPGPCYRNLRTNVPSQLMAVKLLDMPLSTPEYVPHERVLAYLQEIYFRYGVDKATTYGALVEEVKKVGEKWAVAWTTSQKHHANGHLEVDHTSYFDAVVVATGHYHAPRVPDIPGLSTIGKHFPSRVMHSKQYRRPEGLSDKVKIAPKNSDGPAYANIEQSCKNVLIIGGGVSSIDIAKDMTTARHIYQSTRNSGFDLDARMLPQNASRVDEVVSFEMQDSDRVLGDDEPLPVSATMSNGETLRGIDSILCCTGYHISLPFFQHLHDDDMRPEDADDAVLVTDGAQVHNLHKDIFYIPDPTLAFIGLPTYTFTHSVFDFQAITIAHVFSGIADLPGRAEAREEYLDKVRKLGVGRKFHSLLSKEEVYVNDLVSWMNKARIGRGLALIDGFSANWFAAKDALRKRYQEQSKTGDFS
ncbi:Flavin monooxygenase-like protein [Cordyceps fumosorosea ARSEF 2679]|uniref:Flavin monooxygenase-like protein n=1 Tax=Cordyceps fumosorosea (strain ARSEF 2679) TaxID=1081104 RepID=A0A168DG40_CORFA|nr:Flavin monooxygenase-like protein [Cordyceps fumosorosea ARSEF 2679]OAA72575.1 Flavin monooxygenase-like protein [Cordyceps fumosorosea ARSEF 2679]